MANREPKTLFKGTLLTSAQTVLFSVPANQKISNIQTTVTNVSVSGAPTFDLWFVESGDAIDNNKLIHKNKSVAGATTFSSSHTAIHTLEAGVVAYAQASTASILTFRLSGVLITLNNPV